MTKHVLIIDPNPFVRAMHASGLVGLGYTTDEATTLHEGKTLLQNGSQPSLIITAATLPDGSAEDVKALARTKSLGFAPRVVISTAEPDNTPTTELMLHRPARFQNLASLFNQGQSGSVGK